MGDAPMNFIKVFRFLEHTRASPFRGKCATRWTPCVNPKQLHGFDHKINRAIWCP